MILKASPFLTLHSPTIFNPSSSSSSSSFLRPIPIVGRRGINHSNGYYYKSSIGAKADHEQITGIVFEPFEELRHHERNLVPIFPDQSLARYNFSDGCEAAINQQINVEYSNSYIYNAMYAYFDRDNVALKGLARYFKESSDEERKHAERFMEYQNERGGRVKLQSILMPLSEFEHPEKGDALYAMELALSLEKLTTEKLQNLRAVAKQCNDVQTVDFVDGNFLAEQVKAIKMISEYVSQLRRVGKGHGVWHFDQMLLHDAT